MPGPLDGIAVVDLTSYIAGSYAGMMLADMGARVTKVEALAGDSFRELPGFYGWNRGKRSIAVDLKTPAGCQIVEQLAERSDVFMENMRPGVADRLGAGYERLHALNPRLVYSSVTAFGSTGPYVDRPGFDPLLQAMSGAMALQGFGGPPQYLRIAVTDYYAASLAAQAILAALFVRERTGKGQRVETSLLNAAIALQSGNFVDYKGKQHMFRDNPTYRLYRAGDGQWFFLACGNQTFWVKLCKALGLEPLADDPRFASWLLRLDHREALLPLRGGRRRRDGDAQSPRRSQRDERDDAPGADRLLRRARRRRHRTRGRGDRHRPARFLRWRRHPRVRRAPGADRLPRIPQARRFPSGDGPVSAAHHRRHPRLRAGWRARAGARLRHPRRQR